METGLDTRFQYCLIGSIVKVFFPYFASMVQESLGNAMVTEGLFRWI